MIGGRFFVLVLGWLAVLAGCTEIGVSTGKGPTRAEARKQALAQTTGPLILLDVPAGGGKSGLNWRAPKRAIAGAQQSGRAATGGVWGTADRRSVTTRSGMVVATRGLGHDLMSSRAQDLTDLITAKRAGQGLRIQRYLSPTYAEVEISAQCRVTPGARLSSTLWLVHEFCRTGRGQAANEFLNTYHVDGSGQIVVADQWLTPGLGRVRVTRLR
jgi:hypothetical protein